MGDYRFEDGTLHIVVSELGDWKKEMLVGIHEAVEALLLIAAGKDVMCSTTFDLEFEEARKRSVSIRQHSKAYERFSFRGRQVDVGAEPGDDPDAPYKVEHTFATAVERMLAGVMGVDWDDYTNACEAQSQT